MIKCALYSVVGFCLLIPAAVAELPAYNDVPPDHPSAAAIAYVSEHKIFRGYDDGSFRPEHYVNRAELTAIMMRLSSSSSSSARCTGALPFSDLTVDTWYTPFVCQAFLQSTVTGYGDGTFRPAAFVTFTEGAKIILGGLRRQDAALDGWLKKEESAASMIDAADQWYGPYLRVLAARGMIPPSIPALQAPLTRGDIAELLYRSKAAITNLPSGDLDSLKRAVLPPLALPVLVYHHVRPQEGWAKTTWSYLMTVSPDTFTRQMRWLKDHGYQSIDLDTAADILAGTRRGPRKPVVMTFDDNNLSQYDSAAPILEQFGFRGVFYLVANRLENPATVDRTRAVDLVRRGHSVQSHTLSHANLTNLSSDQIDQQLTESRRILEELTGRPVRHIAYPLTAHNTEVRERTRLAGYRTGSIMDPRFAGAGTDLFRLPRIMMTDDTDLQKILP